MHIRIRLADHVIGIDCIHDHSHFLKDYLTDEEEEFTVSISNEDIEREKNHEVNGSYTDHYLETLAIYRRICEKLIDYDIILYHGSCVCKDGIGYLFGARSGTGKSTHAKFWRACYPDCFIVNDDKPLLKITDEGVFAYGTPWDGKHHLSRNVCVPLKNIVVLRRGETNRIRPVEPIEAFADIYAQIYSLENTSGMVKLLALTDKMLGKVKVYELSCNLSPVAAKVAYEGMK